MLCKSLRAHSEYWIPASETGQSPARRESVLLLLLRPPLAMSPASGRAPCSAGLGCLYTLNVHGDTAAQFQRILKLKVLSFSPLGRVRLSATPRAAARQASLRFTISGSVLKFTSNASVMPSKHLILCRPLLLLPSIFPSVRVFSNESVLCIRWPKYWSFSFNISHSNEYSALISFRMDWLDLLAVRGSHKSLLQHHSSKASILRHSAFFIVQLSHPYVTTG